jgi:histidine ammonia-lyase
MNDSAALLLSGKNLSLEDIHHVARSGRQVGLAASALESVDASRQLIETILESGVAVYGVNTGFGKLSDVRIPGEHLSEL